MSMYRPKALDVDKMERMFEDSIRYQGQRTALEMAKIEAYHSGYSEAIRNCQQALYCSNYELLVPSSKEIIREAFYELCKELDITGSDIYDNPKLSLDEMAAMLAERIRAVYTPSTD